VADAASGVAQGRGADLGDVLAALLQQQPEVGGVAEGRLLLRLGRLRGLVVQWLDRWVVVARLVAVEGDLERGRDLVAAAQRWPQLEALAQGAQQCEPAIGERRRRTVFRASKCLRRDGPHTVAISVLITMETSLETARMIQVEDRDVQLHLDGNEWPKGLPRRKTWTRREDDGLLERILVSGEKPEQQLATPLKERVLRFPSAPIHGLHRLSQDQVNMGPVESFHSLRLLSHKNKKPVTRIFLMHNGLNETRRMGLYYQLASYLITQDEGTVCILRPFPGHLTRCAFSGLTETPLDHYLWDGLHLFRQFLRFMIETRWLLSTIVRYSYYHCASGSGLLGENTNPNQSRLNTHRLAEEMLAEWKKLYNASKSAIKQQGAKAPKMPPKPPSQETFEQAITSLRRALAFDPDDGLDGSAYVPEAEPELHTIGYSLGGFAAQSVFMSWGFLVASCSTLLSGGAMRELAPTAFADPEEWQTVLHSLRYELDDAMMDWRFSRSRKRSVAGLDPNLFLYLKRTFYEVFQQEYRGSFQTRLVAFRQRMLFVVGGDDPIVEPQSVLDSGPPDGINMIAVGGLGHFLEGSPQGRVEREQRLFWLPEIGRTIGQLAAKAAEKHRTDLESTWLGEDDLLPGPDGEEETADDETAEGNGPEDKDADGEGKNGDQKTPVRLSIAERLEVERDGALPNRLFQRSLDDLLARAADRSGEGMLFILKNEAPTFLLDERALQQHAAALYHEDVSIVDYITAVRSRRPILRKARERICVVLPWNLETVVRGIDAGLQHPSQSEGSGEQMARAPDSKLTWSKLQAKCMRWTEGEDHQHAVRVFDGREPADPDLLLSATAWGRLDMEKPKHSLVTALPDCWVWMSNEFLGHRKDNPQSIKDNLRSLRAEVPPYVEKTKESERMIAEKMRTDDLRMVTLSRARYNPRFRGRIIAEPRQAQELLLQAALCLVASVPFREFPFARESPDRKRVKRAPRRG
jgi:hypothetical protein